MSVSSNYTSDEIREAVQRLVLSTIRRPYDTLGVRRTDISFNDVQQAAAGVFVLYPNSPYYVLQLGIRRLQDLITSEAAILDKLVAAVSDVARRVLPIDDVSPLFNAQAALQELGSAAVARGGVYQDITKLPAYQRYASNVDVFLSGPGQTVKEAGAIVQTPQEARAAIPGLLTQLVKAHQNLVARVTGLSNGVVDYAKVSLPSIVAQSVLSNSAKLIGADATALQALTPEARLGFIRQVVLNLLSTKAVVQTFGSFSGPTDFYTLDGLGTPFSDAQHLAEPAVTTSDHSGGYSIVVGVSDDLHVTADGGAPFDLILSPSLVAEVNGTTDDSGFVIGDGVNPSTGTNSAIPNNNKFKLKVDNTTYVATLGLSSPGTAGVLTGTGNTTTGAWYGGGGTLDGATIELVVNGVSSRTCTLTAPVNAADLVAQLNGVFNTSPDGLIVSNVLDRLVFTTINLGAGASILVGTGTGYATIGIVPGTLVAGSSSPRTADQVATDIQAALPAGVVAESYYAPLEFHGLMDIPLGVDTTWTLTVPGSSDFVALGVKPGDTAKVLAGPNAGYWPITGVAAGTITVTGATALQAGALLEIGPAHRRVRLRCTNPTVQVPAETRLTVFGDDVPSRNALTTLGFSNGTFSQCLLSTADQVAADINSKTSVLTAAAKTFASITSPARTDITNPNLVSFVETAVVGTTSFVGTTLTLTVTQVTTPGPLHPSFSATIALRGGPSPGHGYTISTVNGGPLTPEYLPEVGDVFVATGSFAGVGAAGVDAEIGPTLAAVKYQVVIINDGPNAGTYFVAGPGQTDIDVVLQRALPVVRAFTSSTSSPLTMSAGFGDMYLELSSKNTTTTSALVLSGNAEPLFWFATPHTQLGSSQWLKLPSVPRGLQVGDVLEYYDTDYKAPARSFVIGAVINGLKVIGVNPDANGDLIPDGVSWQFTVQPVPFARLRYGTKNSFSQVQVLLNAWLANSVNQPLYFENLNRLINPLLVNANPTAAQVGAAKNALLALYAYLTTAEATAVLGQPAAALESAIPTFTVESVSAIDALLRTFVEKGSDRATDLLLQGAFSTFFSLGADESSYSGAFQAATRAVAMQDLPVRRMNRPEVQTSRLLAQTQSPDFEFVAASVNEVLPGAQVDPPISYGESSSFGRTTGSGGAGG